jgi:hypothetical protein
MIASTMTTQSQVGISYLLIGASSGVLPRLTVFVITQPTFPKNTPGRAGLARADVGTDAGTVRLANRELMFSKAHAWIQVGSGAAPRTTETRTGRTDGGSGGAPSTCMGYFVFTTLVLHDPPVATDLRRVLEE